MLGNIMSDRLLLVVVTLIGFAMCAVGIGQVAARGAWLQPLSIVGYALGALILAIVGATLLGVPLPLIDSTRSAIIAVMLLALVKIVLTQLHRAFA
jgi:hypothetical protein